MRELIAYAARQGVTVHVAHLPAPYRGYYDAERRQVVYDFNLTPIERRVVLAHELGHDHHGHNCEEDPRSERAADAFAARLLIDPARYAELERITHDVASIAEELRVTPDLVVVYQEHCLTRLRGVTYVRPRMGINQWHYRSSYA
ncbi:ImmA/IrrE family metallo-endopeptidase [Microbacterium sp. CFH 90308]|uniref:ImmA/IrrE family metallo-endopeptidase n=1 Tax=Microbacterium salsuginis TaxID=2722803 RepID=A0ABX1K6G8_9MICO|nr:ImmA/IrrE family metallo-endopeptidase [Microbacterium sp. CFH 90308]NLP82604.1 ImmA/IrrE family metallo-endopeptidase [Microbacterium sp. CFH 90308]